MQRDLTKGSITRGLFRFAVPYLIANFLQTFYGLTDLFITGQFNGAASISGVSIGSQLMHMVTVVIVGLAMGSTVMISRAFGAKDKKSVIRCIGNTVTLFAAFAVVLTAMLCLLINPIITALSTPPEAVAETRRYMMICFAGIPFITAYNVIAGVFRGLGDTATPMIFVAIAGVINIGLDWFMIGPLHMGAAGAALATVISQAVSVLLELAAFRKMENAVRISLSDLKPDSSVMRHIASIGVPIACQDGFIQISFLVITAIANSRGVETAAAVGIVEKIISFLFLVPSAMLGTLSSFAAQNAGAGLHRRGRQALRISVLFCCAYGAVIFVLCQFLSEGIVSLFVRDDAAVVRLGGEYLRSYSADVFFAGIQFSFSGYFSAYGKAIYSFIHNIISITCVRIPGVWLTSKWFPDTLYPMGWASPLGSAVSSVICVGFYLHMRHSEVSEGIYT